MKITDKTLREQLRLTDREIMRRQELLQFTDEDREQLLSYKPLIAENIDDLVDEFYEEQTAIDEVARVIGDSESLARLKKRMRKYILDLFDGEYGSDYSQSRLQIGMVHKRIGVTPKLYLSAVRNLYSRLSDHIDGSSTKDCTNCKRGLSSLYKILMYDLQLVFDTYIHGLLDELRQRNDEIESYAQSLEDTVKERTRQLSELARTDGLTGLLDHRGFHDDIRRELARGQRTGEVLSLIYFDLDGFKNVNDMLGHKEGDDILVATGNVMRSVVRVEDVAARYGGDEFCIILPHTNEEQAQIFAKRLIETATPVFAGTGVTFSVGVATTAHDEVIDADTLISSADRAMYVSKQTPGFAVTVASLLEAEQDEEVAD